MALILAHDGSIAFGLQPPPIQLYRVMQSCPCVAQQVECGFGYSGAAARVGPSGGDDDMVQFIGRKITSILRDQ